MKRAFEAHKWPSVKHLKNDMLFRRFFSVNLIFEILRSYMLLILPSFLYFDKGRRSYPRASCNFIIVSCSRF